MREENLNFDYIPTEGVTKDCLPINCLDQCIYYIYRNRCQASLKPIWPAFLRNMNPALISTKGKLLINNLSFGNEDIFKTIYSICDIEDIADEKKILSILKKYDLLILEAQIGDFDHLRVDIPKNINHYILLVQYDESNVFYVDHPSGFTDNKEEFVNREKGIGRMPFKKLMNMIQNGAKIKIVETDEEQLDMNNIFLDRCLLKMAEEFFKVDSNNVSFYGISFYNYMIELCNRINIDFEKCNITRLTRFFMEARWRRQVIRESIKLNFNSDVYKESVELLDESINLWSNVANHFRKQILRNNLYLGSKFSEQLGKIKSCEEEYHENILNIVNKDLCLI